MALNDATGLETLDGEELPKIDPTQNPRNQRMMEIAQEEGQHKADGVEFVDIDTADYESKPQPKEESPKVEKEEPKEEPKEVRKFKIKANGQEMELTEDEIIKRAELAEGAEQKFQEAARLRREAEEFRQQQPKLEAVPSIDDDDRALARALQMGSEEEAAQVVKRLRNSQSGIQPGQIAGVVEMVSAGNQFRKDYPEIFSDPDMTKIALDKDEQLVKSGDRRSYLERYKSIGDELIKKYKLRSEVVTQDKLDKKASLQLVPRASVKNAPPQSEDDEEQTASQIIAAEAKRRGQQFVR